MVNRTGDCPNPACGKSWDGGDIKDRLKMLDLYSFRSDEEIEKIAAENYGWTPENPKRFSDAIHHNIPEHDIDALECPHCRSVFEVSTGHYFKSLSALYQSKQQQDEATGEAPGGISNE